MVIALWLACSIVCAAIASSKKRSAISAFFAGLLFGFFAVIYYVCVPTLEPVPVVIASANPALEGPQKTCAYCFSLIPAQATKCRYCQSDVSVTVAKSLEGGGQ
jgi:hypothetical protein